ncbi:helix-turn-helix transcriptional regulator [Burkholderia ubonensis]|uniref:helix-turn-helix transcriptional regulator n=1 Tax=Burkholderia ubonensis TaxID=101571 RepID=UPI0034E937C1
MAQPRASHSNKRNRNASTRLNRGGFGRPFLEILMSTIQGTQRAELPAEGFVCRRQLLQVVPFSPSTLRRRIADGSFPRPVRVSNRLNAWAVASVRDWIARTAQA